MLLEPEIAPAYTSLTYPLFRSQLHTLGTRQTTVAIGAYDDASRPIGLALADLRSDGQAVVESLYVRPEYRSRGVGTELLAELERVVRQRESHTMALSYTTEPQTSHPLESLLPHQGWIAAQPQMRIYCSSLSMMSQTPWWYQYNLPAQFSLFPFAELTRAEYERIQQQQAIAPWYADDLDPFKADSPVERLNSVGVRYQGDVVGWMVTHRITPDTIRYSSLVLRPDLQKLGRAIALVGSAIRLQLKAMTPDRFVCAVKCTNQPMLQFAERRLAPLATSIKETRFTWKSL